MRESLRTLGAVVALASLAACGGSRLTRRERAWPDDGCGIGEDPHVIVCGGRELARVECRSERHEGWKCRNLTVRYADGEVAALHHAGPAVERPYPPDKIDLEAAYGPVVARDGRTVWFRTRSPGADWRWHAYDVAAGTLRDVDGGRVGAAVESGRAVPLGDAGRGR